MLVWAFFSIVRWGMLCKLRECGIVRECAIIWLTNKCCQRKRRYCLRGHAGLGSRPSVVEQTRGLGHSAMHMMTGVQTGPGQWQHPGWMYDYWCDCVRGSTWLVESWSWFIIVIKRRSGKNPISPTVKDRDSGTKKKQKQSKMMNYDSMILWTIL